MIVVKTTKGQGFAGVLSYMLNTNSAPVVIRHTTGGTSHAHIVSGGKTVTKPIRKGAK